MNDPSHWRTRAVQMRRLAAIEPDAELREVMERCALDYDRMAERAGTYRVPAELFVEGVLKNADTHSQRR